MPSSRNPTAIDPYHQTIHRETFRRIAPTLLYLTHSQAGSLRLLRWPLEVSINRKLMARTESTMLPLGTAVPYFELPDVVSGKPIRLSQFHDKKALLVMFICRHCPYVKHVQNDLSRLGRDNRDQSVGIVAISSNDITAYPDDSPANLRQMAEQIGFTFPFCYDESQDVARAYSAACTPDFFLFDQNRRLVYRGQLDDSRPGNTVPVTGRDLRAAIDAVLNNQPVSSAQKPSLGCNIKWRFN
jgi:peroxiredoxin